MKHFVNLMVMYLAWLAGCLIAFYIVYMGWQTALLIYAALEGFRWGYALVSNASAFLLGLGCLVAVIYVEHYYRTGLDKGLLLKRFFKVTLIEVGVLAIFFALMLLVS